MISVIIPLYNKEAIIERTLRSVLSQDYDDFEVVIVDDGSTDNSLAVVERELPKIKREFNVNTNVELIQQENGGPSKARNTGVKNAKGDWIVFLDADDELLPEALSRFAHLIEEYRNSGFVAFPYYNSNGENRTLVDDKLCGVIENPFKSFYYRDINPRTGSYAIRRETVLTCLFNEEIRRFEDDEHLFNVFRHLGSSRKGKMVYGTEPSMVSNAEYSAASHGRKDIKEDFLGHIEFKGKCFWEKMCLYKMFLAERPNYPEQSKALYPILYKRYDLLFLHKLLNKVHR